MNDEIMGRWIVELKAGPQFYLDRRSTNARRILSAFDADLVADPAQADLLWLRRGVGKMLPQLEPGQLINHFANEGAMINKGRLTGNLNRIGAPDFYPTSFRLYDATECQAFFDQLPGKDEPVQHWILKPANLSKGIGIKVLREFDGLHRQYQAGDLSDPVVDPKLEYIAQRYIENPLLLNGKKSELRVYWMIASIDPLRVLLFDEGTVRLTTQEFSLEDLDNPLIHVTNTYQQKRHGNLDSAANLKWTFADLESYLVEDLAIAQAGFFENDFKPRVRACLKTVVEAVAAQLADTKTEASCFGVYGADVILDATLKPWLTEIQKNPGLSHDDPIKINIVPEMLLEAVRIALANELDDWRELPRRFEWVIGP